LLGRVVELHLRFLPGNLQNIVFALEHLATF
jgi:hypothetical protein